MSRRVSYEDGDFRVPSGKYAKEWQTWGDGSVWELTPGVDFTSSIRAFKAHCYYVARTYETTIHVKIRNGLLYLQADPAFSGSVQ
jgi:hypothetical protein